MSGSPEDTLGALAQGDAPVLETLAQMSIDTFERSGLDEQTYLLTRVAALVAMDAAPMSYLLSLGAADEIGIPLETIQGTLTAIAPIVGSARIVAAASNIVHAYGLAAEIVEEAEAESADEP